MESYLLLRGIRTLSVRMPQHAHNALEVAKFLEGSNMVKSVFYPGLLSHPDHELAKKQMHRGCGGMLAFDLGSEKAGIQLVEKLRLINLAVSLGGVESLIEHPASMTHSMVPKKMREAAGITDGLIRLSVGLEHADDLIADLRQALDQI